MGKAKRSTIAITIFPEEIKGSLLLAFCLLLLLLLLMGLFALKEAHEFKRKVELVVENYKKGSQVFSQLGNLTFELNLIAKEQMGWGDTKARARWKENLDQTKAEIDSYILNHLLTSSDPAEREAWEDLQGGVSDYWNHLQTMAAFLRRGIREETLLRSDSRVLASQRRMRLERERILSLHEQAAFKHQQEMVSALERFRFFALSLTGISLLLGMSIMYLSLWDIQRKTDRIRKERDFSQTLLEAIGDGVILLNPSGQVQFANRRSAELLRYRGEEIIGKTYAELLHPEDRAEVEKRYPTSLERQPYSFKSRLIRGDGSAFPALITVAPPLDEGSQSPGWVAVFRDITETEEAERSILQLAHALQETDECVIITDLEEGIIYINKAAERTYGYPISELMGRHVSQLRTPDDHLFFGPEIKVASLAKGWRGELMNRRKDGTVFPVFLTTSLIRDEKGSPRAVVGVARDISERKKIEDEILHRSRDLASLHLITATMSRSLDLQETLEKAAEELMKALDVDACEIYILQGGSSKPIQIVCRGMEKDYFQQGSLPNIEPAWHKPMALTGDAVIIDDLEQDRSYVSLLSQGFLSFASIPIIFKGTLLGVLNVAIRRPAGFRPPNIDLLAATASQMGIFIENVRSFEREKERVEELSSLIQVAQAVNSSLDLEKVLHSIVEKAAQVMKAPAANLMLWDEQSGLLEWSANLGLPREWIAGVGSLRMGESISGLVVSTGAPIAILEMSQDPRFLYPELAEQFGFHSFLGVPLIFRDKPIGGLYIVTVEPHPFSDREIRLLSALASQAAFAIENARLFQETEQLASENFRRYQEVSILNELGVAMRSHNQLDWLLPIILTGVTFGGGLGFNRAILFLTDEKDQFLEGKLGMGPSSSEDARLIWSDLVRRKQSLLEIIQTLSLDSIARSPFNLLARSLKVPLRPEGGIIARTALEERSFNIQDTASPREAINMEFEGRVMAQSFAAVPLLAKERVIGVILVDNLYNGRAISEDDLHFLEALANQAGMAIESAQLYSRLEDANRQLLESHRQIMQMERLALLGEMSATVAHQIRNPLVAIGGFARRLSHMDPEKGNQREYLDIIQKEVKRLEQTVKNILSASREIQPKFVSGDLNRVVRECLALYQDRIKEQRVNLYAQLRSDLPKIPLDSAQMSHALSNLLDNALEAMPGGGDLHISTYLSPEAVHMEITDTGPGIPPEAFDVIFDPFFTTKVNGTGLGLALTYRIISNHQGKIEARNLPGGGATFSLSLPLESEIPQPVNKDEEVI